MWTQIMGKVRLALEPMVNQWWQVPLYVSARGLTTSLMHAGTLGLEIEFDLEAHVLEIRAADGPRRQVALEPRSVADFFAATIAALDELGARPEILARPVEVVEAIPFELDDKHRSYDANAVHRFWQALVQAHRVLTLFRSRFIGKASPVHFFWGAPDLAVTRFSGRPAPKHAGGAPNCADWVMERAYSHEVSSCGFWPGGNEEGSFYSYAYPNLRASRSGGFRPLPPTTKSWVSSCSLTRQCERPRTPTRSCSRFSRAPTRQRRSSVDGTDRHSRRRGDARSVTARGNAFSNVFDRKGHPVYAPSASSRRPEPKRWRPVPAAGRGTRPPAHRLLSLRSGSWAAWTSVLCTS
jgi:hypothetical protein